MLYLAPSLFFITIVFDKMFLLKFCEFITDSLIQISLNSF